MNTVKRIITISLIIFFLLIILYSISGVAWLYFYDKAEFGNALKDAGSSFVAVGGENIWMLILTFGWILGWFIYSFYRRRMKLPQSVVQIHIFIALTFFLALELIAEGFINAPVNSLQFLALIAQSAFYIIIGILLVLRKRTVAYLYMALFLMQLVFYSTILKPTSVSQVTIGLLFIGTIAWFILLRRNWNQLH